MATGSDARVGIAKETTWGTRVAPTRFLPILGESLTYEPQRTYVDVIGVGRWARLSRITGRTTGGSFRGVVPTRQFGFLLDGLNNNTNTPVQQGATAAYQTTFTLDTPVVKSYSMQVQMPPTNTSTLLPQDVLGAKFFGLTLSWDEGGPLNYEIPVVFKTLDLGQTLASYVAPPAFDFFAYGDSGNNISIAGSSVSATGRIFGSGSITLSMTPRNAQAFGAGGTNTEPVENAKPTAELAFTADFIDNTELNRTLNDTVADVIVTFKHPTVIASTFFPTIEVEIKDCKFTTPRATVAGTDALSQSVTATASSSTGQPVIIRYIEASSSL